MYLDASGAVIEGRSLIGEQAAGTPGTVAGLALAHRRFGTLPWARVLAPAIDLAREGFEPPAPLVAGVRASAAGEFAGLNFGAHFGAMTTGALFKQPDLARALTAIAQAGPAGFYEGWVADAIVARMGRGAHKGLITYADLAAYRARWRRPVRGRWRGMDVFTAPPPSSGGVALLQLLGMKAARADLFGGVPPNSAQYVHLVAELSKRVFADRALHLGDPDFVDVPVSRLTAPAYLGRRAAEIDPRAPSPTPAVRSGIERPHTTHFSVIDKAGVAVANTYTLNGGFGAGVVVDGAGFLLNNEMDDFSIKPGVPNQFGVVGGDANAIAPGKRPLSSMTPTILARGGAPVMALGSPGGSRIITTVFQTLANVFDHGMGLEAAVAAPRFHHQLLPENTIFEEPHAGLDPAVRAELIARGYRFERQGWNGDMAAVLMVDGQAQVAPDPRARGVGTTVG
jgi:gamma-glutamyltranspeptidase/glutathione hydrolase